MKYAPPGVNPVGYDEQSRESFNEIAQRVQVNTQPATEEFAREKSEGMPVDPHSAARTVDTMNQRSTKYTLWRLRMRRNPVR